jgi:hypothetical protein
MDANSRSRKVYFAGLAVVATVDGVVLAYAAYQCYFLRQSWKMIICLVGALLWFSVAKYFFRKYKTRNY